MCRAYLYCVGYEIGSVGTPGADVCVVRQNAYVYYKAGVPALSAGSETRDPVRRAVRADRRAPWPVCRRVRVALPRAGGALRVWAR